MRASSCAQPVGFVPRTAASPGHAGPARPLPADTAAPTTRIVTLPAQGLRALRPPARVRTLRGTLWLTVDGVGEDIVLEAGESRHFAGSARVLAYALGGEVSFEVRAAARNGPRGPVGSALALLARLAHRLRRVRPQPEAAA